MVWVSDCGYEMKYVVPIIGCDGIVVSSTYKGMKRGEILEADKFPREMWFRPGTKRKAMPDFFRADGLWLVSERFRNLLQTFDLGRTHFIELKLFKSDRNRTPVEGRFFVLNIAETKDAFIPELSDGRPVGDDPATAQLWLPKMTGPVFTLQRTAETGVDLWLDPLIYKAFFFSDRLARACRKEKIKSLKFFRVAVTD